MVERDKNHPSRDPVVARQRERLRPQPRRRRRLAARASTRRGRCTTRARSRATGPAGTGATDVVCPMYADVDSIEAFAARQRRPAAADPVRVLARDGQQQRRPGRLLRRVRPPRRAAGRLRLGVDRPRHPRTDERGASTGPTAATSARRGTTRTSAPTASCGPTARRTRRCTSSSTWPRRCAVEHARRPGAFRIHNRNAFTRPVDHLRGEWEGGALPTQRRVRRSTSATASTSRSASTTATTRSRGGSSSCARPSRARGAARATGSRRSPFVLDGPHLQLWRAPTDNDGLPLHPGKHRRAARALARAGPRPGSRGVAAPPGGARGSRTAGAVRARGRAAGRRDLPRVGVVLTLAPGLERLEYFGRGPWENYPDRQASAVVGPVHEHRDRPVRALHRAAGARPPRRRPLAAR